ncbi:hypothetical protein ASPZODRAFT_56548 [Penicilliopsis zonata CBS 506.65]|uniref:Aminoglycoside phosphotransferase domain-containing protein n=1 Tax=Penicilliopsis zonata CBS 506.65 TaxID=1073090 RepID=A0A1L9SWM9_9EURO|nr:hypothetical protein ASPZODRAFT_56548 [Penicilliopsis zonata CBS 506.65]OJJ51612.1 hypothetical protein ASPZODRAFT_56548 [Penicilliopsis zonata CBS 506.65]
MSPPGLEIDTSEEHQLQSILYPLFPHTVRLQRVQSLEGHLHPLRLLTLSNGVQLILKSYPRPTTALLRRERFLLETEARMLAILNQSANPCLPQLFQYDPQGAAGQSAFLLRQYVKGTTLQEMQTLLSPQERNDIDRHLGFLANMVGQHVAPLFGPLDRVASGVGSQSWREAFFALFEGVLRDAEDMFIHLPYSEIRYEISRLAPSLEQITLPRLVVIDFGHPSQVLLDQDSRQLSGVIDLSHAIWGDILMAEIFDDASPAVWDGFGLQLTQTKLEQARLLLYSCYRSVYRITAQYYRNRDETTEIDARRRLTATIAKLEAMELA